jgi:hypothetical protein
MKVIEWDGTVWSGTRSQFLHDKIDFEILIQASFNEQDRDLLNLA